jgi:uncharacterized protein YndB with AHSA1/START domain
MPEPTVIHSTFSLERSYPYPPERVFAAFSDPQIKQRWFSPGEDQEVEKFTMDFRVGGAERLVYRIAPGAPVTGVITNEGIIQDIVPNQRVVTASTMALNDRRFSSSLVTMELLPRDGGTDLICTHQGAFFEGSDGPRIREAGWRALLDRLEEQLRSAG